MCFLTGGPGADLGSQGRSFWEVMLEPLSEIGVGVNEVKRGDANGIPGKRASTCKGPEVGMK